MRDCLFLKGVIDFTHFCPCYEIEMALVTLTNHHWLMNHGRLVLLFWLDLTAVFSTVNYDLLSHHLAAVGTYGISLQWLISFLFV